MLSAFELMEVRPVQFILPVVLGIASTILKLVTMALFLPLVVGLMTGDFSRLDRKIQISKILPGDNPDQLVVILLSTIAVVALIRWVCAYFASISLSRLSQGARSTLNKKVIQSYLEFGQQYYDLHRFGFLASRFLKLPIRGQRFVSFVADLLISVVAFLCFLLLMAWISLPLTVGALVLLIVYLYVYKQISKRMEGLDDKVSDIEDETASIVSDYLLNHQLIRIAGAQQVVTRKLDQTEVLGSHARYEEDKVDAVIDPLRDLMTIVVMLVFAALAARYVAAIDLADVSVYILFFLVFRRAMAHFSSFLTAPVKWLRLEEKIKFLHKLLDRSDKFVVPSGAESFTALERGIEVSKLDFSYANKKPVLLDVSLNIRAKQRNIIVGTTGSGKSTLLRLLLRQYDCPNGTIFMDDRDIRSINTGALLKNSSYAGAHPMFLNDTVRHNIILGMGDVSDSDLKEAARKACALDFIESLENGFDEPIGDQGTLISSGEQQRLALVRVFLRNADLVLLDEATSSLDSATESLIQDELDEFTRGKTVVIIAHRLSNLRSGDHVIVFKKGQVVEQGNRDELLEAGGELTRLWQVQQHH